MRHALALDEILPAPSHLWDLARFVPVAPKKLRRTLPRRCAAAPRNTLAYVSMGIAGEAELQFGSCEQAVAWFRRAIEVNRDHPYPILRWGTALAQLGRLDDAHSAVKAGLALEPDVSISRARASWTAMRADSDVFGGAEPIRRHEQGLGPRTMTAARRLAAILAARVVGYSWARTRRVPAPVCGRFEAHFVELTVT